MATPVNLIGPGVGGYIKDPASAGRAFSPSRLSMAGWAERGLVDTPTLISSFDEFERVFGRLNTKGLMALCFQAYLDRHGEESLPSLAERTGINERYIRRRIQVLKLPKNILKAWGQGKLKYGHLEQL